MGFVQIFVAAACSTKPIANEVARRLLMSREKGAAHLFARRVVACGVQRCADDNLISASESVSVYVSRRLAATAQVERLDGLQHMRIPAGQQYRSPGSAYVEGDASSASYFLAGATITGDQHRCRLSRPKAPVVLRHKNVRLWQCTAI